jgi:hypothetical protein
MVSGFVDREWAAHHYTGWYREHFGHHHGVASVAAQEAAPPVLVDPAHESLVAVGLSTCQPAGAPALAVMRSTPGADTTTIEPSWPPDAILWAVSLEAAQDATREEQEEEPQSRPPDAMILWAVSLEVDQDATGEEQDEEPQSRPPDPILCAVSLEAAQDDAGEEQDEEPQSRPPDAIQRAVSLEAAQDAPGEAQEEEPQSWPPDAILWAVSLEAAHDAPGEEQDDQDATGEAQEEESQSLPQMSVAADDGGAGAAAAA